MKALLPLAMVTLTGCTSGRNDSINDCSTPAHNSYTGVALATASGSATFATDDPYCAFVLTGSNAMYDEIFSAWRKSPYQGEIRPVFISLEGEIVAQKKGELAPFFRVRAVREISVNFSEEQASRAFDLRMAMPLPTRRVGLAVGDPEGRIMLTD